jgi:hypothetical protein
MKIMIGMMKFESVISQAGGYPSIYSEINEMEWRLGGGLVQQQIIFHSRLCSTKTNV